MSLAEISAAEFEKFLLLVVRIGAIMTVAPMFGHRNVPAIIKVGLIVTFSLLLLPTLRPMTTKLPDSFLGLTAVLFKEVASGLAIGFTSLMLFLAVQFAGSIIGLQMGFGIVNVIDPSSHLEIPLIGQFQLLLTTLIFLALDGHHLVLSAIVSSIKAVPLGQMNFSSGMVELVTRAGISTLGAGIKLGAPCIVTLFLLDVAMGMVARTIPQMNIFIVGFPLKIGIGFIMLAASLPLFAYVFAKLLGGLQGQLDSLILAMRP